MPVVGGSTFRWAVVITVLGYGVICTSVSNALSTISEQARFQSSSAFEEHLDPFSVGADELLLLANRLRSMVVAEVAKLASAAEYFFKMGVEGKRLRPTVLLLMATALNGPRPRGAAEAAVNTLSLELRSWTLLPMIQNYLDPKFRQAPSAPSHRPRSLLSRPENLLVKETRGGR